MRPIASARWPALDDLSGFLIGAHARLEAKALLTRDGRRYRQAFPGLRLVLPGGSPP